VQQKIRLLVLREIECGIENTNGTQFVYFTKNGEKDTTDEPVLTSIVD